MELSKEKLVKDKLLNLLKINKATLIRSKFDFGSKSNIYQNNVYGYNVEIMDNFKITIEYKRDENVYPLVYDFQMFYDDISKKVVIKSTARALSFSDSYIYMNTIKHSKDKNYILLNEIFNLFFKNYFELYKKHKLKPMLQGKSYLIRDYDVSFFKLEDNHTIKQDKNVI